MNLRNLVPGMADTTGVGQETAAVCESFDEDPGKSATIASEMSGIFYCGDNLEILDELRLIPDDSVDLIYLDPPFNSGRVFNVVYRNSQAQENAFKDYWSWDEAAATFSRLVESARAPARIRQLLRGLHDLLVDDDSDLLAYITMMTPRLMALHRVLKATGSFYLHCDPTASHYLKIVLDSIFGSRNLRNEVIWKRTNSHNSAKRFGPIHDVILYYAKSDSAVCNALVTEYSEKYLAKFGKRDDQGRAFQDVTLTGPGVRNGESGKPWRGYDPTAKGRHWQPASYVYDKYREITGEELGDYPLLDRLDKLDQVGMLYWTKNGVPRYKQLLQDAEGVPIPDVWTDIDPVNSQARERTGWPTQKPLALLTRILEASSNENDVVLDPFCGCGTTIEACERLGRRWIGIDIARKSVDVTRSRFERLGVEAPTVEWVPHDRDAAAALAEESGLKFEEWARRKIGAVKRRRKDRGIDGEALFRDGDQITHVLVSVKSGRALNPAMVRELRGTMERERAPVGVLVTMYEPSKEMRREATHAGFLTGRGGEQIPRIQLLTIEQVFAGAGIVAPGRNVTEMPKPTLPMGQARPLEQLGLKLDTLKPPKKARKKAVEKVVEPEQQPLAVAPKKKSVRPGR
jgi:DNA modification methylase